jgi:hypothetical protein
MQTNPWVGSQPGDKSALVRISPYLYGQRKLLNIFFLPKLRDLPQHGLDLLGEVFDFGYNQGSVPLDAFDVLRSSQVLRRNFLVWGITGVCTPSGAVPNYLFQVYHTHEGKQRQFFNKALSDGELAGTAQAPMLLAHPYLVLEGDTLECEVQNLSNANLNAQVVLWGGEFD